MQYITQSYTYTYEVKQSKFIAHFVPIKLFKKKLEELQLDHPKARHFVTAQRYLNEYEQIVEHSSDDGEPKGTSGKPSLMVLQGKNIIESGVIIVRYFGGTKLGTGGLVRAYSEAVNGVLNLASLQIYKKEILQKIVLSYNDVRRVEYACQNAYVTIVEKQFLDEVIFILQGKEESVTSLLDELKRVVKTL